MPATIEEILIDCVQEGLGLPRDPIATDIRDLALSFINTEGRKIFDAWPWDNCKLDEFEAPAPDADGVITFESNVETIRAVKAYSAGASNEEGTRVWNQDELLAAADGQEVATDRFLHLADSGGCRRIRVYADDASEYTYKVLALKRYVDAVVDESYDATDPTATPTDYRVATFVIDRAEPALRAFVTDRLRIWDGSPAVGDGASLLAVAKGRDDAADRERRVQPRSPMFDEVGGWW